jgi:hypothetical protein
MTPEDSSRLQKKIARYSRIQHYNTGDFQDTPDTPEHDPGHRIGGYFKIGKMTSKFSCDFSHFNPDHSTG